MIFEASLIHYFPLLPLIAALSNFGIAIYILFRFSANKIARTYIPIPIFSGLWSIAHFLILTAPNETTAFYFDKLDFFASGFCVAFFLRFILIYTNTLRFLSVLNYAILYILPIFFTWISVFTRYITISSFQASWGRWMNYGPMYPFFAWYTVAVTVIGLFSLGFAYKYQSSSVKFKYRYIIYAFLLPLIGGILTEVLAPIFHIVFPPLTTPFFALSVIIIAMIIRKYDFLSFSDLISLEMIINTITDSIVVIDKSGRIILTNKQSERVLHYSQDELQSKFIQEILLNENREVCKPAVFLDNPMKDIRMLLAAKNLTEVPVSITTSNIYILDNQYVVLVIHNMTQILELVASLKLKTQEAEESKTVLERKVEEIQKMNTLMVNRELKMIELKKRNKELEAKLEEVNKRIIHN